MRYLERLGAEKLQHFSTWDFLTIDAIHREQPLNAAMRQRVASLIAAGAIESVGRGKGQRLLLSQALYETIGQGGVHTRRKGLDHATKKALLARHLQERGDMGAPMAELKQVLPADSHRSVLRLAQELRTAGLAELRGQRRLARWYATAALRQSGSSGVNGF